MTYCKVLLRSLLVLAVLLLAYVLVGVAPASASLVTLRDWAAVRGTDNHVYVAHFWSDGSWSSWQSLGGATPSPLGICENAGSVVVVGRGTNNGIYYNSLGTINSLGPSWSGWFSPPGGGVTIDQPACAYVGGWFIVVRGTGNELYWNFYNGAWSGWQDLHGASASAPVLVSTPSLGRLDLFVQGTDNGIYHKAYTGMWSTSWDSPGGKTSSKPAAALYTSVSGCPSSCSEHDWLDLFVRGTDNNIYWNSFLIGGSWAGWGSLSGATLSAPTLAYYDNGCSPGTLSNCHSIEALAVRGTDNAVYHKTFSNGWWGWDSPGGTIYSSPAMAYVPGSSAQFLLLVEGGGYNLYSNTVTGVPSTWGTYSSVSGATPSDPALVAVL